MARPRRACTALASGARRRKRREQRRSRLAQAARCLMHARQPVHPHQRRRRRRRNKPELPWSCRMRCREPRVSQRPVGTHAEHHRQASATWCESVPLSPPSAAWLQRAGGLVQARRRRSAGKRACASASGCCLRQAAARGCSQQQPLPRRAGNTAAIPRARGVHGANAAGSAQRPQPGRRDH